ncbi:MAG: ABC transporter substrate-binding protein [Betaproteobacteria bacterium]
MHLHISRRTLLKALGAQSAIALLSSPLLAKVNLPWPAKPAAKAKGSSENPIVLGSIKILGFVPSYDLPDIARAAGWYVKVLDFPSSSQRAAALMQGSIDIAMLGWNATTKLSSEGRPVVVVANAFGGGQAIIAKKDSGIAAIRDLKGKKVATLLGSMNDIHLLSQLSNAGLKAEEVQILQMNLPDMPIALARGDIDAMVGDEPNSSVERWPRLLGQYSRFLK